MTCSRWETFQRKINELVARWAIEDDVVDVRDPLLDLTICPTCGSDVTRQDQDRVLDHFAGAGGIDAGAR